MSLRQCVKVGSISGLVTQTSKKLLTEPVMTYFTDAYTQQQALTHQNFSLFESDI